MPDANLLSSLADGAAPASPLPPSATTALRCWLQTQRRAHARAGEIRAAEVGTVEVRRTMRQLCDEARRQGVRIEELIVLLKQLWATLPSDAGDGRPDGRRDRREVLDGIVRVCIEEFYAPVWGASGRPADGRPADGAPAGA